MEKLKLTLTDLNIALSRNNVRFLLTRFNPKVVTDLDILVDSENFDKTVSLMKDLGYEAKSHDHALGGRISGMQVNLVKKDRFQIDLHQDFTWRKLRYLDLEFLWEGSKKTKIEGVEVQVPNNIKDVFLILINLIFEKTYFMKNDWEVLSKNINDISKSKELNNQIVKYNWSGTWNQFLKWNRRINNKNNFPIFLPIWLVIYSYVEKTVKDQNIDIKSLFYYIFFRTRYFLIKKLPY